MPAESARPKHCRAVFEKFSVTNSTPLVHARLFRIASSDISEKVGFTVISHSTFSSELTFENFHTLCLHDANNVCCGVLQSVAVCCRGGGQFSSTAMLPGQSFSTLQHTATDCNILQHCNTLQHTTTHCNTLQHTAKHSHALQQTGTHCNTLLRTATHCHALQHTVTHCNTRQHVSGVI